MNGQLFQLPVTRWHLTAAEEALVDTLHRPRFDPSVELLALTPSPELAAALRASAPEIVRAWVAEIREAIPSLASMSFDELKDSTLATAQRVDN